MCDTCLPHRTVACRSDAATHRCATQATTFSGLMRMPISRRQILSKMGTGLIMALIGGALHGTSAWAAPTRSDSRVPYLVLIVLDGARTDYFTVPGIPHVQALIENGTRYKHAFTGILESETPAAHTSIGTGCLPVRDGILSFAWGTREDVRVSIFDPVKVRHGAMEAIIKRSGVPTLAGQVHAAYPSAKVVALSGSKYYAADAIGGPDADVIMYFQGTSNGQFVPTYIPSHPPPPGIQNSPGLIYRDRNMSLGMENHLAMQLAVDTFQRMRQQVTLINLPEFDWPLGHVDGATRSPRAVQTLMQQFDRDLAMLKEAYRHAGVLHRTLFVLLGDHGMMPLTHTVPASELRAAVERAGTSIIAESYSSGAYFWVKDPMRAQRAAQNIVSLRNPHIRSVYLRYATNRAGFAYTPVSGRPAVSVPGAEQAHQYLLSSFAGPNGPHIVVVFTEGTGSEPGGQAHWKADHGGANWEAQHVPLVLSGPGVRKGTVSSSPARLIDVAPTTLQLMGIPYGHMQGIPLADAMTSPPAWAVQGQQRTNASLLPLVHALRQQSKRERAR